MRKVIFLIHVSLDGFVAGPNGEMDWIVYHDDLIEHTYLLHDRTDAAIYGRNTYQMMANYWPTVLDDPSSDAYTVAHARWLEGATKFLVSTSMKTSDWANTVIINQNIAEEMNRIKQQSGKDIWLIGSPGLARSFMDLDLIDEYHINVNPVVLGNGQPLFGNLSDTLPLKLLEAKTFEGGVVGLRYEPVRQQ